MSKALCALCVAALLSRARIAQAEGANPLVLNWVRGDGAESCVASKELDAKLRETLAADNIEPGALSIEGWVQRDAEHSRWRARLRVLNAEEETVGTRELTSSEASCGALTPSVVLVLAILVELGSGARRAQPEASPPAAPEERCPICESAPTSPAPNKEVAPTKAVAARWQAEPLAALTFAIGLLPSPAVGPQLGLRVTSPWPLSFLVHAGYWAGGSEPLANTGANASVDFSAYHGDLSVCLSLPNTGAFWLAGCWGAALGARRTKVDGLKDAPDRSRFYAAALAGAQFGYAVSSRLSLGLETSFLGFGGEDHYSYYDQNGTLQVAFRTNRFAGLFALGLGVRL
jgi:hypothetical protein